MSEDNNEKATIYEVIFTCTKDGEESLIGPDLPIISKSGKTYWGKPPHWHYCDGYLEEYNKKHGFA